jgi:hypothetical protein
MLSGHPEGTRPRKGGPYRPNVNDNGVSATLLTVDR